MAFLLRMKTGIRLTKFLREISNKKVNALQMVRTIHLSITTNNTLSNGYIKPQQSHTQLNNQSDFLNRY